MSIRSLEREIDRLRKMADPHLYQSFSDLQRTSREREAELLESLEKMKRRTWSLRENVKSQKTECKEKMKEMQFKYERERFMYEMECENEMWKSQMKIAKRSADEAIRSIESVPDPYEETEKYFGYFDRVNETWNEQRENLMEIIEDMSENHAVLLRQVQEESERTARERDEKQEALKTLKSTMESSEKEMEAEIKELKENIESFKEQDDDEDWWEKEKKTTNEKLLSDYIEPLQGQDDKPLTKDEVESLI